MKINIRSKLILAISLLTVVLFSLVALLFINEKKDEIADDIYVNALAFSKLTASNVIFNYELYLAESGFVYFNREIQSIFEQNDDVTGIKVISFAGEVLYDSETDVDKKYEGKERMIANLELLRQLKSEHISLRTFGREARVIYLLEAVNGEVSYVDWYERPVEPLEAGSMIDFLVVPANEKYAVVYSLDYHNLDARVAIMIRRIIYLAIFGVMLGMLLSFFMSKQVTRPVAELVGGVEEIAKGNFKTRVNIKTRDELAFLGSSFNQMAEDLEGSVEAKLYKERVTRELELATEIQQRIVPKNVPQIKGIDIAAGLIPAEEIGGDVYDFLPVNDERVFMYLGDVTGHGVPAGIVSSIANALFYGFAGKEDLQKIMIEVNRVLTAKTMTTMFMTLCLMEWDNANNLLKYVSAGHEQIIHYRAREGKAVFLPFGGVALGMMKEVAHVMHEELVDFQVGDFLIVYSDGIPEAWKNTKEQYGFDRFVEVVNRFGATVKSPVEMKDAILQDLQTFTAGYKQMDDITIVVIKKV